MTSNVALHLFVRNASRADYKEEQTPAGLKRRLATTPPALKRSSKRAGSQIYEPAERDEMRG